MKNQILISTILPASPERVYKAWLNSKEHSAFTGTNSKVTSRKGGKFSAWNDYITGRNLELEPNKRILQAWRSTDFSESAEDSRLELIFKKEGKSTKLTLIHNNIPEGQADSYKKGWKDFYFIPMKKYFKEK